MKKLLLILCSLLCLFLITSCGKVTSVYNGSNAFSDLAYPRYPGTDWGITPETFFAALGENPEDFTLTELETNGLPCAYYLIETVDYFENPVQLRAEFSSVNFDETLRLSKVVLGYEESFSEEAVSDYCRRLYQLLKKKQGAKFRPIEATKTGWWTLYSEQTTDDFSPEIKEKLDQSFLYSAKKLEIAVEDSDSYTKMLGAKELSSIQVTRPDKGQGFYVSFSGATIAAELGHLAVYEKIVRE